MNWMHAVKNSIWNHQLNGLFFPFPINYVWESEWRIFAFYFSCLRDELIRNSNILWLKKHRAKRRKKEINSSEILRLSALTQRITGKWYWCDDRT